MAENPDDASGPDLKSVVALATTVVGTFTALAGTASVGGGVERVARNVPFLAGAAVVAFGVATVVAGFNILGMPAGRSAPVSRHPLTVAFLLFVAGLGLAFWAVVDTTGDRSRPSVDVAVRTDAGGVLTVEGTVRSSGLNAREYLRVKVVGITNGTAGDDPLLLATEGAGSSGEVNAKFSFPVRVAVDGLLVKAWPGTKEPLCVLPTIGHAGTAGCFAVWLSSNP